jgi:prevent-host-death family protein
MVMRKTALAARKKQKGVKPYTGLRQIAAGEFKAKCLAIMDEVNETGKPIVVTKRGEPVVEVVPIRAAKERKKKDPIFGRLKGIVTIVGDPDDLVKPVFPLEDYDMLK